MRDLVFIVLALILSSVIALSGCAGKLTDISNQVKEKREKIAQRVGQLEEKYRTGREIYAEMRNAIQERWDDIPAELQEKLRDFDKKAKEFDAQVIELKKNLDNANSRIKSLEQKARKADKKWDELLTTLKNISQVLVAIS